MARIGRATPSKDGFDVYGRVIEAGLMKPGRIFSAGYGVSETNESLVANIEGNVRLLQNSIVYGKIHSN